MKSWLLALVCSVGIVLSAVYAQEQAPSSQALPSAESEQLNEHEATRTGKPIVRWYHDHYPPTFISHGPHKNQGYGDKTYEFLKANLPQFEHVKVPSTFNRALAQLRDQDGVCVMGMFKTPEREAYTAFTNVLVKTLPNRLVVLKERRALVEPYLSHKGEIELDRLMADERLTAGIITDRFYSHGINAAIEKYRASGRYVTLPVPRYGTLLNRHRIDYAFGYAYEAAYQFRMLGEPNAYATYSIAGEPNLMYGYVGCSKKALGIRVAEAINGVINMAGDPPIYRRWMEEWLDDFALADYRRALAAEAR